MATTSPNGWTVEPFGRGGRRRIFHEGTLYAAAVLRKCGRRFRPSLRQRLLAAHLANASPRSALHGGSGQ